MIFLFERWGVYRDVWLYILSVQHVPALGCHGKQDTVASVAQPVKFT